MLDICSNTCILCGLAHVRHALLRIGRETNIGFDNGMCNEGSRGRSYSNLKSNSYNLMW